MGDSINVRGLTAHLKDAAGTVQGRVTRDFYPVFLLKGGGGVQISITVLCIQCTQVLSTSICGPSRFGTEGSILHMTPSSKKMTLSPL